MAEFSNLLRLYVFAWEAVHGWAVHHVRHLAK